jgi:hypothetical protein
VAVATKGRELMNCWNSAIPDVHPDNPEAFLNGRFLINPTK